MSPTTRSPDSRSSCGTRRKRCRRQPIRGSSATWTLEFRVVSENRFEDAATGSTWDLQGLAVAGELKGTRLEYVPSFITEWYGWAAFHPETAIYDYELAKQVVGVAAESDARRGLR